MQIADFSFNLSVNSLRHENDDGEELSEPNVALSMVPKSGFVAQEEEGKSNAKIGRWLLGEEKKKPHILIFDI